MLIPGIKWLQYLGEDGNFYYILKTLRVHICLDNLNPSDKDKDNIKLTNNYTTN